MNVLFLCTGNSCRSILSEALFNAQAPQGFKAYSAGSHPSGQVHPLSLKALERLHINTNGLYSKPSEACADCGIDVVISVCDQAANEACPTFFGSTMRVHWGLSDPSHLDLPEEAKIQAFLATANTIQRRLEAFFALDFVSLPHQELQLALHHIAQTVGES